MINRELFEGAYRKYWDHIESQTTKRYTLNSYELCDSLDKTEWQLPFIGFMVEGELKESINLLNAWQRKLADLEIWSEVLEGYGEDDAWSLRIHFVEALVHYCMLQPSSTRDRLGKVATNGVHQANLRVISGYKDRLDQDALESGRFLSRKKVEMQLERIGRQWVTGDRLLEALRQMDSKEYRQQTFNYRNEASHFIAPRVELGEVQFVTRSIVPYTEMIQQVDGSYRFEEVVGRKAISYGFGGVRPLTLKEIIEANSKEYLLAVSALNAYSDLLREALAAMTPTESVVATEGNKD